MHRLTALLLTVAGLALAGCGKVKEGSAAQPAARPEVRAYRIDTGRVARTYHSIGQVYSDKRATISSPLTGRILKREVAVGDRAKAGDVLFRIDTEELGRERAVLTAKLAEAQSLVVEAQSRIEEAKAKRASLAADLDYAEYNEARIKRLSEESSAAENELRQVATVRRSLTNTLKQAEASVDVAKHTLEAKRATVAVIASQLAELEGRIADAEVRAPFDCTIEGTLKDTGDWVTRNPATDVLTVSSNSYRLLMITVPDRYYQGVKDVSVVKAQLPGEEEIEATVLAVSNVLMADSKGCLLRNLIPPKHGDLPVGMTLPVSVEVDRRESALRVPNAALRRIEARTLVYRINTNGRLEVVPVTIELEGDRFSAVSGSIADGDRVAVGNLEELGDGVLVEVAP